ncbi:MAG: hypothetical protein KJZ72_03775 [Anaerolineales bacterium]|nr:hypothetical protein [Anaerolineales bacterium]
MSNQSSTIVQRIWKYCNVPRLSIAAGVESTPVASLSRVGRLRQSMLKSAFEGKLLS